MRSGVEYTSTVATLPAAEYTAVTDGVPVDLRFHGGNLIHISTGAFAGTTPGVEVRIEHSGSTEDEDFVRPGQEEVDGVPDELRSGAEGYEIQMNASSELTVAYIGDKRFVRVSIVTVSGTTPEIPLCVLVTRMDPKVIPDGD